MKRAPEGTTWTTGRFRRWRGWGCLALALLCGTTLPARAQSLRIVTYNVDLDTGTTTPSTDLFTVLEAIGEESMNGVLQPLDILALEETTSNPTTVQPIYLQLNTDYGATIYAMVNYQGTQSGSATVGNGPNALIYNTTTLQIVLQNGAEAAGVTGTPGTQGAYKVFRQVVRYEFHAVGAATGLNFYVYVSHMKSSANGDDAANQGDRNLEAQLIRADVAKLPPGTSVIYVGDFNLDGSAEAAYQTLTASGKGQGIDPLNVPQNNAEIWNSSTYVKLLTESATKLRYRDDIQFVTPDIYNGTVAAALRYVPGSLHAFGNNGRTALGTSVDQTSNTALDALVGPISGATARLALTKASDHLPVVADYTVPTPYTNWQVQHFTQAELVNPAVSGDRADPDGDGIANLLEYALNLDPKQAATLGAPTVGQTTVSGQQYLTLTYTRVVAATGITYLPQVSADLGTWNAGTGYTVPVSSTTSADGTTQTVVVRDAVALNGTNRRFLRLSVSRP